MKKIIRRIQDKDYGDERTVNNSPSKAMARFDGISFSAYIDHESVMTNRSIEIEHRCPSEKFSLPYRTQVTFDVYINY